MDAGAFVQENKRWLLGCALGLVVFFVARMVIAAAFDPEPQRRQARSIASSARQADNAVYDAAALAALRKEGEELQQEKGRLREQLAFVHDPVFKVEGHGAPDEYLGRIGRELKLRIQKAAAQREVEAGDDKFRWPSPTGQDDVRAVLFGLELVDVASQRLFAAHDAVRALEPLALGLAALSFTVEERHGTRGPEPRTRPGEVDLRDLFEQQRVTFEFRCDAATARAFFESCREPGKALVVERLEVVQPARRNEPLLVKGVLLGIAFKEG